jgi:hypothetical protein
MKTCKHWQDIGNPQGGECTLHNRTQSFGVCRACLDNTSKDWPAANNMLQRAKIGTKIAKATNADRNKALWRMQKAGANFERRLIIFLISQI